MRSLRTSVCLAGGQTTSIAGYSAPTANGCQCRRAGSEGAIRCLQDNAFAYLPADEATHKRAFGNLLDVPDNYPKLVVSMDPVIGADHKGVRHLHVREFLVTDW